MPRPPRDYRDLVCWQQAIELALEVNALADSLPRREWDSASQLRRAARSVHLNIAEGNGRRTCADYLRFLGDARGSLNEVDSELRYLTRRYPANALTAPALERVLHVAKPLSGLIKAIERKRDAEG